MSRLRFEPFQLDVTTGELRKHGQPVRLPPQPAKVLTLLAKNAGRLVTREEICAWVWTGDTFIDFEQGLNYCIKQIRIALGDDARSPKYMETLQRRGYRFIANVERMAETAAAPSDKVVIAVLPFSNVSGDPEKDYFSDGLTDEMITQLGRLNPDALGVIARTSAMKYKGTRKTIAEIARELGVSYLLEGSVRHAGQRVRVSAQLVQAGDQTQLWAESFDLDVSDILKLQRDVAHAISAAIQLTLTPHSRQRLHLAPSVNADAYEQYLKARFLWNKRTRASIEQAIGHFEKAIETDPASALAYAALGDCHVALGSQLWVLPSQAASKGNDALARALDLEPALAEAHAALGFIRSQYEYRWADAEHEFRCALDLNANYATAHHWFAFFLSAVGRPGEAIAAIRTAERLDPFSPIITTNVGTVLFWAREYEAAIAQYETVLSRDANFWIAHWMLGLAYEQTGQFAAAVREHRKAIDVSEGVSPVLPPSLARACALAGDGDEAERLLGGLRAQPCVSFFHLATAHVALGQHDLAVRCLRAARDQQETWAAFMKVDARLDPLHEDPAYVDLVRTMAL